MPTRTAPRSRADAYLSSRVRFGIKFGLETMRALCEELHHPERAFASLLVAGTNGKGSVVAYADAALRASALVTVEKDHEAYLGSTLAAIAHEKAGVLRARRATVLGPLAPEARAAVEREAASAGARLVSAREGVAVKETNDGLEVRTPHFTYRGLRT